MISSRRELALSCLACSILTMSLAVETELPTITASAMLPLTKDKIKIVAFAAELSQAAYDMEQALEDGVTGYFDTGADAALTLELDAYCFIAFRGSLSPAKITSDSIEDWLFQNMDFDKYFVRNRKNESEGCFVQEGYFEAYTGVGEDNIHNFIDTCMLKGGKQLVFTGHSQGGAAAAVAAVANIEYNPLTITFGQPPFLAKDETCRILKKQHIWRFINTENGAQGLQYDPVPFVELLPLRSLGGHVGASVHLPPNYEGILIPDPNSTHIFYRSMNETIAYMDLKHLDKLTDETEAFSAHALSYYLAKVQFLEKYGPDRLFVDGYAPGTQCNTNFECQNFVVNGTGGCINYYCSDRLSKDTCVRGTDCQSGRCEYMWNAERVCRDKEKSGSPCNEENDCQSGVCRLFVCK